MPTFRRFIAFVRSLLLAFTAAVERLRHPFRISPVYDVRADPDVGVLAPPASRIVGRRVQVPMFEIVSNPTIRLSEIRSRRFNILERTERSAIQQIQADEDRAIFAALDGLGKALPSDEQEGPPVYCPTHWERILADCD